MQGMERRLTHALKAWKDDPLRKPLILRGARQVGKTWLLQEFGQAHYERVGYVNCQRDRSVAAIFEGDLDPDRIIQGLEIASGTKIDPGTTMVIIDEIQDVPDALTSLKYFEEQRPDIHVAAAGSLLGLALRKAAFPVGKVNFLDLHPLDFDEFLRGTGETQLADLVEEQNWGLIEAFRERLIELLRLYMFVGGMPEAVARYGEGQSLPVVRRVQNDILRGYENDFAKYAEANVSRRISQVWKSMPSQLAQENKRFVFSKAGARGRDLAAAIQWLIDAGLVYRVTRFEKPAQPPEAYGDSQIFKLFFHDVGLLGALSNLDPAVLLEGAGVFEEFKGALTEQYVLQEIVAAQNKMPLYWGRGAEHGHAELDFVIEKAAGLVPIEVKAEENLRSKSLRAYIDRYHPHEALRFSLANYREQQDMKNVPLYAIRPRLT